MLEKIKEIPFVDESRAVKILSHGQKVYLERYDRVLWASEKTTFEQDGFSCYVEADKFFTLLPDIATMSQNTCLDIKLKNGAEYQLPFLTVQWEAPEFPDSLAQRIDFNFTDLMLCTLKNLVKPELQCIYIDSEGAVTCDFITACITDKVKTDTPILIPADVQILVDGKTGDLMTDDERIFIIGEGYALATTKPTLSEEPWWNDLRQLICNEEFTTATPLRESLKRLVMFSDYVSFANNRATAGSNFEPFTFPTVEGKRYEIERLRKILETATKMAERQGNLILSNDKSLFLLSAVEEE